MEWGEVRLLIEERVANDTARKFNNKVECKESQKRIKDIIHSQEETREQNSDNERQRTSIMMTPLNKGAER